METSEIIKKIMNRPMDPYRKICKYIYCQKEFIAKRLNQEYCCYECKKKANNLKAKQKRDAIKGINNILIHNRDIVKESYDNGKIHVTLEELESIGFKYNYHTEMKKIEDLNIRIPMYFEYGLILKDKQLNTFEIWKSS